MNPVEPQRGDAGNSPTWVRLLAVALAFSLVLLGVYWAALSSPFLFDDHPNFAPLRAWLRGEISLPIVLFENGSGPLGRSISMASFALTAALHGMNPFAFKLTNLIIHLLCAGMIVMIARRAVVSDAPARRNSVDRLALCAALLWAIHPIQVSTVAYAVQRMAQLSALFSLVALWAFVVAATEDQRQARRRVFLFIVVPLATLLAAFSKENGLLVPVLCLALHLGWLQKRQHIPRSELRVFLGAGLALPALGLLGVMWWRPEALLAGYRLRDFTLWERLLTQPRVLLDYLWGLMAPGHVTAVVHFDDVVISTGWWSPPFTTLAMLTWAALLLAAWRVRSSHSYVIGGLLFFLGGHVMESTFLPLEIAFEHRNYLPSVGIFLALITGMQRWQAYRANAALATPMVGAILLIFLTFTASQTFLRTWEWRSRESLVVRAATLRPLSARAQLDFAQVAMENGNLSLGRSTMQQLKQFASPRVRYMGRVYVAFFDCLQGQSVSSQALADFAENATQPLTLSELTVAEAAVRLVQSGACQSVSTAQLAEVVTRIANKTSQPETDLARWRLRYLAASAYEIANLPDSALRQAKIAWENSGHDLQIGLLLLRLYTQLALDDEADAMHQQLTKTVPEGFHEIHRVLNEWKSSPKEVGERDE